MQKNSTTTPINLKYYQKCITISLFRPNVINLIANHLAENNLPKDGIPIDAGNLCDLFAKSRISRIAKLMESDHVVKSIVDNIIENSKLFDINTLGLDIHMYNDIKNSVYSESFDQIYDLSLTVRDTPCTAICSKGNR
jgi:hypothetical protein